MPIKRPVVNDVDDNVDDDDDNDVESVESESECESDESESESVESDSDDTESIVCEACNKEFFDEKTAYKHSQTVSHKRKWCIFHENQ